MPADAMASVINNLIQQTKHADAETILRECLTIREKTEPDAWRTFNTQSLLGEAILGQKKYDEAESLLVKGYEGLKARFSQPGATVVAAKNASTPASTPADAAQARYVASTTKFAHRHDPTRPVAMAVADWPGVDCQPAWAPLDAIGVNEYFGWYDAGGGLTDDRDALSSFLDSRRTCYRHKALFISEFGFDGARNGPVEERGTYAFQADAVAYHLGVFASKKWLAGAVYFLLADSVSTPGYTGGDPFPRPPLLFKGLIGFNGVQKPAWGVAAAALPSQAVAISDREIPAPNVVALAGTSGTLWYATPTQLKHLDASGKLLGAYALPRGVSVAAGSPGEPFPVARDGGMWFMATKQLHGRKVWLIGSISRTGHIKLRKLRRGHGGNLLVRDSHGKLFVLDTENHRVQQIRM